VVGVALAVAVGVLVGPGVGVAPSVSPPTKGRNTACCAVCAAGSSVASAGSGVSGAVGLPTVDGTAEDGAAGCAKKEACPRASGSRLFSNSHVRAPKPVVGAFWLPANCVSATLSGRAMHISAARAKRHNVVVAVLPAEPARLAGKATPRWLSKRRTGLIAQPPEQCIRVYPSPSVGSLTAPLYHATSASQNTVESAAAPIDTACVTRYTPCAKTCYAETQTAWTSACRLRASPVRT